MKKNIILIIKGFLIGIAKIIPGVSGAMLAISFGLYDKGINAITNFFNDVKENLKFLIPLGIGVFLAIVLGSKGVIYFLNNHYLITMLFFLGLISGGLPHIYKKTRNSYNLSNILIFGIVFILIIGLNFLNIYNESNTNSNFLMMLFLGVIDAATMVIPGISGTAIFMMIGKYEIVMNTMSSLGSLNAIISNSDIIIPFFLGLVLGVVIVAKIMDYLFKKFRVQTYFAILSLALASVITLLVDTLSVVNFTMTLLFGVVLFIIGFIVSYKLDN